MKRSKSKSSPALKYLVLLIVVILLVVAFKVTLKKQEGNQIDNPEKETTSTNTNTGENNNTEKEKETTKPTEKDEETKKEEQTKPVEQVKPDEIIGGKESLDVKQYVFYDTKVIASEETTYHTSGYKYFIVGNKYTLDNYLNNCMKSSLESGVQSKYETVNANTLDKVKEDLSSNDTFKDKYVLFIVDYSSSEIAGEIESVENNEGEIIVTIKRDPSAEHKSTYMTYIIPLNTNSIDSVKVSYAK